MHIVNSRLQAVGSPVTGNRKPGSRAGAGTESGLPAGSVAGTEGGRPPEGLMGTGEGGGGTGGGGGRARGTHFYTPMSETALRLAERIVAACPCAESVKFVNSGAEATFAALRLARGFPGRGKILEFEGRYHGPH